MTRIAILASHPIQYQAPLFRCLAARADVALRVFFCWNFGVTKNFDPGFKREFLWDIPLLDGYDSEFVPNIAKRPHTDHFWGLINPSIATRIKDFRPDALITHGYGHATEAAVIAAARSLRIPVLLRGDSQLTESRKAWVRAAKRVVLGGLFRRLSGAISAGSLNKKYYLHYGVPEERIFFAPYSVDNQFFISRAAAAKRAAAERRAQLGIDAHRTTFVFAGKLADYKGPQDLIRAFGQLSPDNAALILAGEGPTRGELEALARTFPKAAIHFLGFANQTEMPAIYALGDVFVIPSRTEPWGLAVNEAMSMSCPILASAEVGAAPDLVDATNGWVFPAGDVAALSRCLDEARRDKRRLQTMGAASLERIAAWDIDKTAEGFVQAARAVA